MDAWIEDQWRAMGAPVSRKPNARLGAWFDASDGSVAALRAAIQAGRWTDVQTHAKVLTSAALGQLEQEPGDQVRRRLADAVAVGDWIQHVRFIRDAMRGDFETMSFEATKEDIFAGDPFLDVADLVPPYAVDAALNMNLDAVLTRAVGAGAFDAQTPKEFASLFDVADVELAEHVMTKADTSDVRMQVENVLRLDTLQRDIAISTVELLGTRVVKELERAKVSAAPLVAQWGDTFRDVWKMIGQRDQLDVFLDLDARLVPRHPRVDSTAVARGVAPGSSPFTTAWQGEVVSRAVAVLGSDEIFENADRRTIFSARNSDDPRRPKLKPEQSLSIASDQVVILASDPEGRKWVLKTAPNIDDEEQNWLRLGVEGGKIPDIVKGYNIFGVDMLVVERLWRLDRTDDEYEVGAQLLRDQLPYLHKFALHSDIKPDNIMKRIHTLASGMKPVYFLIDMDLTMERVGEGFDRRLKTPMFNSAMPGSAFPMTWRADVLELLYTLNAMALHRQYHSTPKVHVYGPDKMASRFALAKAVDSEPKRSITRKFLLSDSYSDPMTAFPPSGTVVWDVVEKQLKSMTIGSGASKGIADAFAVLAKQPSAHPENPETFTAYGQIADALQLVNISVFQRERVRLGYEPLTPTAAAGPFAGAPICWTCARGDEELEGTMYHEGDTTPQRMFCSARCQQVFHTTPAGQKIM